MEFNFSYYRTENILEEVFLRLALLVFFRFVLPVLSFS